MDHKQFRRLITAGILAGAICVLTLASFASLVIATDPEMTPTITLVAVTVLLLGNTAISLLAGAWVFRTLEKYGQQRWWHGYAAATEDFKAGGAEVVRIPATRNGRG